MSVAGPLRSQTGITQALTGNGQNIGLPFTGFNKKVSPGAARTGTTLSAGIADGQTICIINTDAGANTITFAASATSRVADGTSAVIPGLRAMIFTWDAGTTLWYRQGA